MNFKVTLYHCILLKRGFMNRKFIFHSMMFQILNSWLSMNFFHGIQNVQYSNFRFIKIYILTCLKFISLDMEVIISLDYIIVKYNLWCLLLLLAPHKNHSAMTCSCCEFLLSNRNRFAIPQSKISSIIFPRSNSHAPSNNQLRQFPMYSTSACA